MKTYNVPEIQNWRKFTEEVWGTKELRWVKILRDALRAFNRLARQISYGYEMSALIDFGEWSGAGEDDDLEACLMMVAEKFGIENAFDIHLLELEDQMVAEKVWQDRCKADMRSSDIQELKGLLDRLDIADAHYKRTKRFLDKGEPDYSIDDVSDAWEAGCELVSEIAPYEYRLGIAEFARTSESE